MSMISRQADELHEVADRLWEHGRFVGHGGNVNIDPLMQDAAVIMRDAARTIESLRDSLNEVADRWADAQIDAEVYARENMLLKVHNDTRWHELFGTPERTARTLANNCHRDGCIACAAMGFDCGGGDYDALLEWLREEGETE